MVLASAPANLDTFVKATIFLDGLERDNADIGEGEWVNGVARDKIDSARAWFEILCGVGEGEDGDWPEERIRHFIRCDLSAIHEQIADEGLHFERWPEASTTDEP